MLGRVPLVRRWRASSLVHLKSAVTRLVIAPPRPQSRDYHDHRFPQISTAEVERRIRRLGDALNRFGAVQVRKRDEHLFDMLRPENPDEPAAGAVEAGRRF